jgi:Metallo-peptidase family M12B Reprolysin-like
MNFQSKVALTALRCITVTVFASVFSLAVFKTKPTYAVSIDFYLNIQPIDVCDDSGNNCAFSNFFQAETKKIWEQAGIGINFLSLTKINSSNFSSIDNNNELNNLFNGLGNGQSSNSKTLNMWFVNYIYADPGYITFGVGQLGGNNLAINSPDVLSFNNGNGRIDTIAHEIGHNLGLDHTTYGAGGANNVMTSGSVRTIPSSIFDINPDGNKLDTLVPEQISVARNSQFLTAVPEPVTMLGSLVACVIGVNLKMMQKKGSED